MGAIYCINRASMALETNNNLTGTVPMSTITHLIELTYADDEELVSACLDFLYQYTAYSDNVEEILNKLKLSRILIPRLVSLLMYQAKEARRPATQARAPIVKPSIPVEIPELPKDLIAEIAKFTEPERSIKWLQCCFDENEQREVTQIHLWQSYQNCFAEFTSPTNQMLQASEFIKRVSTTFNGATAQVINTGDTPRFIIKGIQPRQRQLALDGRVIHKCPWEVNGELCNRTYYTPEEGYNHIGKDHLNAPQSAEDTAFASIKADVPKYACHWSRCPDYNEPINCPRTIMIHVRNHVVVPTVENKDTGKESQPDLVQNPAFLYTQQDVRGDPAGLPMTSVLILKNLARYATRVDQGDQIMMDLFGAAKQRLSQIWAYNASLHEHMGDLIMMVSGVTKQRT